MNYELGSARAVLERTPATLSSLLRGLPADWTACNEGPDTWSAFDVLGHLIHGEQTDWIPRVAHILEHGEANPFPPFDRFAQMRASQGKTMDELLDSFVELRADSLRRLDSLRLSPADLERTGRHPALGVVKLREHLATWVAHDLDHVAQIARVMARQYTDAVGPWRQYMRIVRDVPS